MRFPRFTFLKHLFLAIIALIAGISTLEVGLSVREILQPRPETLDSPSPVSFRQSRVLEKSWTTHHRLKPLQSFSVIGADGTPVPVTTNSLGLRGRELEIPKPAGAFRILVLGDELVLAAETPEPDTFCVRLQETLRLHGESGIEVINGGMPGYCPLLSYLLLRHELIAVQPDLVVLHIDMGDIADDHRVRSQTATKNGVPVACPHRDLLQATNRKGIGPWEKFLVVREGQRRLDEWTRDGSSPDDHRDIDAPDGRYAWLRDDPPDWSVYIEQALSPIEHLTRLVEGQGGRLVVATSPAPWQVSAEATNGRGVRRAVGLDESTLFKSRQPFEIISAWCAKRSIPLLDLSESFVQEPRAERLFHVESPRLTVLGHELFARLLAGWIAPALPGAVPTQPPVSPRYLEPPRQAAELQTPNLGVR